MEPAQRTGSVNSPSASFKARLADAIRFWERARVVYNLILIGIVAIWFVATWPRFLPAMHWFLLFQLIGLGLIANALYCAAYFVDIPMQHSAVATDWKCWRWALFTLGTLLAFLVTNYWIADEIYPFVN